MSPWESWFGGCGDEEDQQNENLKKSKGVRGKGRRTWCPGSI